MRSTRLTHFRDKLLNIGLGAGTGMILLLWIASYGVPWNGTILLGTQIKVRLYKDRVLFSFEHSDQNLVTVFLRHGDAKFALGIPGTNGQPTKSFSTEWRGYGYWSGRSTTTTTEWYEGTDGSWGTRSNSIVFENFCIRLPFCLIAGLFGAYPTWQLALWNRKIRRRRRGLCVYCGYDLRGLVEPRCPECGMAFDRTPLDQRATAGR
jgi:hypothetical protein